VEKENIDPVKVSNVIIEYWPQNELKNEKPRARGRKKKGVSVKDSEV